MDELTEMDKINIGAALLSQLDAYEKAAALEDVDPDDDWGNYWNNRVKDLTGTIHRWDPKLLDRD